MNFELPESHKMLRTTIQDFVVNEIAPLAADIDRTELFPWDCVRKMAELGLFGLLTPPAYGGAGPDKLGFLIALEELSAASASLAIIVGFSSTVAALIQELGTEEQKAKYLPVLAKGERLGALGSVEPSGGANYPFTLQTTARLDGDCWVINGTKCFISNGGEADIYLVLARTDPSKGPLGISGFIIEKDTPGFSFGRKDDKMGLRADVTSELIFEDCQVPRANLLAEGIVMPLASVLATIAMPMLGAIGVGLAKAALETAINYVKQRTLLPGQTLANLDNVQCAIAEMSALVDASQMLVYRAGIMSPNQLDLPSALMAGTFPCEAALQVTSQAIQICGTYGYTTTLPLERYFRDARGLTLVAQPVELRKMVLARLKLGLPPISPPGGMPPSSG